MRAAWGRSTREWGAEGIGKRANAKRKQKSEHQQTAKQVGQSKSWMFSMDNFFLHFLASHYISAPLQGASRLFFHSSLLSFSGFSFFPRHISNPFHSFAWQQQPMSCKQTAVTWGDFRLPFGLQAQSGTSPTKILLMLAKQRGQTQYKDAMCSVVRQPDLHYLSFRRLVRGLEKVFLFSQDLLHLYGPDSLNEDLTNTSSPLPLVVSLDISQNKSIVDAIL